LNGHHRLALRTGCLGRHHGSALLAMGDSTDVLAALLFPSISRGVASPFRTNIWRDWSRVQPRFPQFKKSKARPRSNSVDGGSSVGKKRVEETTGVAAALPPERT